MFSSDLVRRSGTTRDILALRDELDRRIKGAIGALRQTARRTTGRTQLTGDRQRVDDGAQRDQRARGETPVGLHASHVARALPEGGGARKLTEEGAAAFAGLRGLLGYRTAATV